MIIACAIDRNFAELAGVLLYSLELNGNVPDAEIWILGDGLRRSDKENIQACAKRVVNFIDISGDFLKSIRNLPTTSYWSRATYARILLPDLMGEKETRVLYLDADIIIKHDISALQTIDMKGAVMAAVPQPGVDKTAFNRRFGRPDDHPYFNAGVLLIDLNEWKKRDAGTEALRLLSTQSFEFLDQDVLNVVAGDNLLCLDDSWNATSKQQDYTDSKIVHFTHAKPDADYCVHPERSSYLAYRSNTPWKSARLKTKRDRRIRRILHSVRKKWVWLRSSLPGVG